MLFRSLFWQSAANATGRMAARTREVMVSCMFVVAAARDGIVEEKIEVCGGGSGCVVD